MKKYISISIAYFDKLNLPKNADSDTILKSLKNFYSNDQYISIPLNFNSKPLYIAKNTCDYFLREYDRYKTISNDNVQVNISNFIESEIYNTLYIEHHTSSRKAIKNLINDFDHKYNNVDHQLEINLLQAYKFVLSNHKFNKANIRTLHGLLTADIDMGNNQLDGSLYRQNNVAINKHHGLAPHLIESHMDELIEYFNNGEDNSYVSKALIMHTYFELVHPYYDFNGRMGRLILYWYATKIKQPNDLLFFSSAMAHYRDQYLKLFNETQHLQCVDMTYPVINLLKIMIANKNNYLILNGIKDYTLNKFKINLSFFAKDMIMRVLALRDIYDQTKDNWIDKATLDVYYTEYAPSVIYNELHKLVSLKLVELTKTRPLKIRFKLDQFIKQD